MDKENEYQSNFIRKIVKMELSDNFVENIKLFSQYLTYTNEDYMYNETYLESFCCEFLNFKKYVKLKNQIVVRIYQAFLSKANNLRLEIVMDQCWHCNVTDFGVVKKINRNKVCRNTIEITGMLEVGKREDIFIKEYVVIKNGELIEEQVTKMIQELKKWTEENRNE